jgi:hypothetical protein
MNPYDKFQLRSDCYAERDLLQALLLLLLLLLASRKNQKAECEVLIKICDAV